MELYDFIKLSRKMPASKDILILISYMYKIVLFLVCKVLQN